MAMEKCSSRWRTINTDKVTTHSASTVKKIDTSAPIEIGMAAGTDGEDASEDGYGKASELAVQAGYKGRVQKYFNSGKGENGANRAGKGQWSKTGGKKGETVGRQYTLRHIAPRGVVTRV